MRFVRRIQERHIENLDIHALHPNEIAPFFENLRVIAPEAIERVDD